MRLLVRGITNPDVTGLDRLADLMRLDDPPPVIFAPNHHSHVDTGLMIRSIPVLAQGPRRRRRGRLLLRPAVEGGAVGARAQRDPDRP
jgi:1-acyl-sn-glycerol-3-phosphate acyltransferase